MENIPHRRMTDGDVDFQKIETRLRKTQVGFWISMIVVFAAIGSMFLFAYWEVKPYDVFDVKQYKVDVIPDTVHGGDTIRTRLAYCKNLPFSPLQITRTLVGQKTQLLLPDDNQTVNHAVGCGTIEKTIDIPKTQNPGTYHIHYIVEYQVNPVRTETVTYDSQDFQIIN